MERRQGTVFIPLSRIVSHRWVYLVSYRTLLRTRASGRRLPLRTRRDTRRRWPPTREELLPPRRPLRRPPRSNHRICPLIIPRLRPPLLTRLPHLTLPYSATRDLPRPQLASTSPSHCLKGFSLSPLVLHYSLIIRRQSSLLLDSDIDFVVHTVSSPFVF